MSAESATTSRSVCWVMRACAWLMLGTFFGGAGCGDVQCPEGTMLDNQFCRRIGAVNAGAGGAHTGSLSTPVVRAGSPAPSAAVGGIGGGVIGSTGVAGTNGAAGAAITGVSAAHCTTTACMPGGSCVEGATDFTCSCSPGYNGTNTKFCKRAYTVGPDTVSDPMTRLVWQLKLSASMYTEPDATAYCIGLKLGTGPWRLPSKYELQTIVDATVAPPGSMIDATVFPGTPASAFWSSTAFNPLPDGTSNTFWDVDFSSGTSNLIASNTKLPVRCVQP